MTTTAAPAEPPPVGEVTDEVVRLRTLSRRLLERTRQLQVALDSRVVIEQAKGILAERYRLDLGDAFELLRAAARRRQLKLHDLAASVVTSRETPEPIEADLRRPSTRPRLGTRA